MSDNLLSQNIQNYFVKLSMSDAKFLRIIRGSVKVDFFDSEITRDMIEICYSYFDLYAEAPGIHFADELETYLKSKSQDEIDLVIKYVDVIEALEIPNFNYVLAKVNGFITAKEYEQGAEEFISQIEKNNLVDAKTVIEKALKSGICAGDDGIQYTTSLIPSYHMNSSSSCVLFPTGITEFDALIDGYKRKQFTCFLGGPKGKKSWALIHVARSALKHGLTVVHFTHELTDEEVELRYDMAFGALTSRRTASDVTYKRHRQDGSVEYEYVAHRDTVHNLQAVQDVRRAIRRFGGEIYIKKYPMGTATMADLNRHLDYLENFEGVKADVVINDYVDIMKLSGHYNSPLRDRLSQTYIEHKQLADERGIAVFTVSQCNRSAIRKKRLSTRDFAEDIKKAANIDLGVALCETDEEAQNSVMRMRIIAGRSVPMDKEFCINTNITVGQFAMQSWLGVDDE